MNKLAALLAALVLGLATAAAADHPAPAAVADGAKDGAGAKDGSKDAPKDGAKKADKIDINTATADELKALPGIGDARAADIIKNRPYNRKDELVSKKVLTKAVYDKIKDQIVAKQAKDGGKTAPPPAAPKG